MRRQTTTVADTVPRRPRLRATTTDAPTGDDAAIAGYRTVIETLASDDLAGRDNGTPGSVAAQDFLIGQLSEFAQPIVAGATGPDAFRQTVRRRHQPGRASFPGAISRIST